MALARAALSRNTVPRSNGDVDDNYPGGIDGGAAFNVSWQSAAPVSVPEGSAFEIDLKGAPPLIAGSDVSLGTITALFSDGSGWSFADDTLSFSGTGIRSFAAQYLWTHNSIPTAVITSPLYLISSVAEPTEPHTHLPSKPVKVIATETLVAGEPGITISVDPGCDPAVIDQPAGNIPTCNVYDGGVLLSAVTLPSPLTLAPRLIGADLGTVDSSGSTVQDGNDYTITDNGGIGAVNATGDNGRIGYLEMSGDWTISVRFPALADIGGTATAPTLAFIVSEALHHLARAFIDFSTNTVLRNRIRPTAGVADTHAGTSYPRPAGAYTRRTQKVGDTLTSEWSEDEINWNLLRSETFALPAVHYVYGLASSNGTGLTTVAPFTNFVAQQGGRVTFTVAPVTPGAKTLTLKWQDDEEIESAASAEIPLTVSTPADVTAPSSPTFDITGGTERITVDITQQSVDAESGFAGHVVKYGTTNPPTTVWANSDQAASRIVQSNFAITGLVAGSYYVSLQPYDAAGNAGSVVVSASTVTVDEDAPPADPIPGTPDNLRFTPTSTSGGVLEVDPEQYATEYFYFRSLTEAYPGPGWTEVNPGVIDGASVQVSGMTGREYFRCRAGNVAGQSNSTVPIPGDPLGQQPTNLLSWNMQAETPTPVVFTSPPTGWNAPHASHGPVPIVSNEQSYTGTHSYKARYTSADAVNLGWSRCEMILPQTADWVTNNRVYPQERWYGFRLYLKDWIIDQSQWEIWQQCHRVNDPEDAPNGNPNLSLHAIPGSPNFRLQMIGDPLEVSPADKSSSVHNSFNLGLIIANQWISFAYHIKWAIDTTGFVRFYRNRSLIASKDNFITACNNKFGPNFKIGIYKSGWKFNPQLTDPNVLERTGYYDDIRLLNPTGKGLTTQQCLDLVSP